MPLARRLITIALAIVGAALFSVAVQGGRWWDVGSEVHVVVGAPAEGELVRRIGTERCFGGECGYGAVAWAGGSSMWERLGVATYVGGQLTALALLALAGAVAARRAGRLAAGVVTVAVVTATAVAIGFHVTAPELPGATLGRAPYLFVGAVLAAIAAVASVVTAKR